MLKFGCDLMCQAIKEWFLGFSCIAILLKFLLKSIVSLPMDWLNYGMWWKSMIDLFSCEGSQSGWTGLVWACIIREWILNYGCYYALDAEPMSKLWFKLWSCWRWADNVISYMLELLSGYIYIPITCWLWEILFSLFSMTPLGNTKMSYYRGVVFSLIWQMA